MLATRDDDDDELGLALTDKRSITSVKQLGSILKIVWSQLPACKTLLYNLTSTYSFTLVIDK